MLYGVSTDINLDFSTLYWYYKCGCNVLQCVTISYSVLQCVTCVRHLAA